MDDYDLAGLDLSTANRSDVLVAVIQTATEKRQLCMDRRWKFKNRKGDIVIIRDLVQKIIGYVNTFKEIGDQAVSHDPGHAALPWAAVRFFLQVGMFL